MTLLWLQPYWTKSEDPPTWARSSTGLLNLDAFLNLLTDTALPEDEWQQDTFTPEMNLLRGGL